MKDFICFGSVLEDKKGNQFFTGIVCNHVSANDVTEIRFSVSGAKNLDSGYLLLEDFLSGFTSYSKEQTRYEDSLIKNSYTVSVSQAKEMPDHMKWRRPAYVGVITVKGEMKHIIKEAWVNFSYGSEIFRPEPNGDIFISCSDTETGEIKKQGTVMILNSFGKMVKVPFAFVYHNK